jgi:hypothetical protein
MSGPWRRWAKLFFGGRGFLLVWFWPWPWERSGPTGGLGLRSLVFGMFNVPHLVVRGEGLWLGYRWKTGRGPPFGGVSDSGSPPSGWLSVGMGLVLVRVEGASLMKGTSVAESLFVGGFFLGRVAIGCSPDVHGDGGAGRLRGLFLVEGSLMIERTFTVLNKMGLHARPRPPWSRRSRNSRARF